MLHISRLPTITRQPAAIPRHWPCLEGTLRENSHYEPDPDQYGAGPCSWSSHWLCFMFINILFYKTLRLPLFEQLSWCGNRLRSLPGAIELHFMVCSAVQFVHVADIWLHSKGQIRCPAVPRKALPARYQSVGQCVLKLSENPSFQEISQVLTDMNHILSRASPSSLIP